MKRFSNLLFAFFLPLTFSLSAFGQGSAPVIVQPGAPGQPTRALPPATRANLPPTSEKDIEFIYGMIAHHAQAVEMTALIESRTKNEDLRRLGARISKSQADEIQFMKRWLTTRGHASSAAKAHSAHGHQMHSTNEETLMPGMLTSKQMDQLRSAKDKEFDKLFLEGMIQHHEGALIMVQDLFNTAGAGQDAELFTFVTDVDSGQRAEIRTMKAMLLTIDG